MVKKKTKRTKRKRARIALELTPQGTERLDALCVELGDVTRSEVIRQALQLYEWAVKEHKGGAKFFKGATLAGAAEVVLFRW